MTSNAEGEDEWKVLSLTHIEYPANDPLGKCFAIFSLLPLAIVVMFITAFFLRLEQIFIDKLHIYIYVLLQERSTHAHIWYRNYCQLFV